MNGKSFVIGLCVILFVTACSSIGGSSRVEKNARDVKTLVIASEKCIITRRLIEGGDSKGLGGVVAAILPTVVNYVFDSYKKSITEVRTSESKGKMYSFLYSGKPYTPINSDTSTLKHIDNIPLAREKKIEGEVSPPEIDSKLGCITVITGRFSKDFIDKTQRDYLDPLEHNKALNTVSLQSVVETLNAYEWGGEVAEDDIYSVYEFSIEHNKINQTFRINDHLLLVNRLLEDEQNAGLVYTTEIAGPGKTEDGTTYAVIIRDFGNVSNGTIKQPDSFDNQISGYYSGIGITPAALKEYTDKAAQKDDSEVRVMPIKIETVMTQTVNPSESAKFVGLLLDSTKGVVSTSLSEELFPKDSSIAIFDAKIALQTAINALSEAGDNEGKKAVAQLQFDKACQQLKALGEPCN